MTLLGRTSSPSEFEHLKPRYSFNRVCSIFNVHPHTLRSWMASGVPGPNGHRIELGYIKLGARKTLFEQDEVERVYRALKTSSADLALA